MNNVTLIRARRPLMLTKVWRSDGEIVPAANAKWFAGKEIQITRLTGILALVEAIERSPRVAIVKEALRKDADLNRLRRTCEAGNDKRTGEPYRPGLTIVPRGWLVLDVDKLQRPAIIDWCDGDALAKYARGLLPQAFRTAACVWQFSGSSGHPSKRNEIRLHLFFMLDQVVLPEVWKNSFAHLDFVDRSIFDKAKIIFTAAPKVEYGSDPLSRRHGLLDGEPVVRVSVDVINHSAELARIEQQIKLGGKRDKRIAQRDGSKREVVRRDMSAPMSEAAAAFVDIIARSNVLRSRHPAYRSERCRRLAFCKLLYESFGIEDEAQLGAAFQSACVGQEDSNGAHDENEALGWVRSESPTGRGFSPYKLLCDASAALHDAGHSETAAQAARLAMVFAQHKGRGVLA